MFRIFRKIPDEHEAAPRKGERGAPRRTWSTRIAWFVLVGGVGLLLTRAALATVIQIHGDGMAPTMLDGESVLMVRGEWGIEAGDIVVYDPTPKIDEGELRDEDEGAAPELPGGDREGELVDERRPPEGQLRNTAVVDVDEVESNWQRVRDRGRAAPRNFRVGRVLAVPGDVVTFNVEGVALGLMVNGNTLLQKDVDPIRLVLAGPPAPGEERHDPREPRLRALAWETLGDHRYPILVGSGETTWPGMALPEDLGPIEIRAEGYLILADNREEGACCDSRSLGWVGPDRLRGEVVLRLAGDPGASPDSDPRARGIAWLP